jgi:hypothetical protein
MPEYLDGTPIQVPQSIRLRIVEQVTAERYLPICILGITELNRCVLGFQPFILGTDKLGEKSLG